MRANVLCLGYSIAEEVGASVRETSAYNWGNLRTCVSVSRVLQVEDYSTCITTVLLSTVGVLLRIGISRLFPTVVANAKMKKELQEIENRILFLLSNSKGNILDDHELIETLASSKKTSTEITLKVHGVNYAALWYILKNEDYQSKRFTICLTRQSINQTHNPLNSSTPHRTSGLYQAR